MKKLDFTNPGGLEWGIQDAQFVYNSLREALLGSASWMDVAGVPIIISGLVITEAGGNFTYTAGWVYANGDLYHVPAQPVPQPLAAGPSYIMAFTPKVIADGTQAAEDSTNADTWLEDYVEVIRGNAGVLLSTCLLYNQGLIKALTEEAWIIVGSGGAAPAYSIGWGGTLKFKLNRFGEVEFFGYTDNAALNVGNEVAVVLPVAYRPTIDIEMVVSGLENGNAIPILITVRTTGQVVVTVPVYGTSKKLYLNSVRFRLS